MGSLVVLKSASKDLIDATLKTFGWSIDKMLINVINEIRYKNHNTMVTVFAGSVNQGCFFTESSTFICVDFDSTQDPA